MSVHSRYQEPLKDQRQFFDELITEEWDSYLNEAWDYTRRYEVARLLEFCKPARVLDIGCGCGFHDVEFASREFVESVDAIDYSQASIRKANEAYPHPNVFRHVADLETDRLEPQYDLVVSFQVIEHLVDADVYFRFAIAACRPGGAIAIMTPNTDRLDNRLRRWRGEKPALVDPQHFHEYSIGELKAIGRRHGLVPRDSFGHTLQSLLFPKLTPADYRRSTRLGAALPRLANVIGVVLEKP
ncbi:MAG: class I SAM-dependent methyltransferase [Acidobacteriota bacterium]|nr:class I SAM-dependent methyltransferase [Acidobacteriota bacterium]